LLCYYADALEGRDDLAAKAWEKFQIEGKQAVKPAKPQRARKTASESSGYGDGASE
jgi:hypothetical protein